MYLNKIYHIDNRGNDTMYLLIFFNPVVIIEADLYFADALNMIIQWSSYDYRDCF